MQSTLVIINKEASKVSNKTIVISNELLNGIRGILVSKKDTFQVERIDEIRKCKAKSYNIEGEKFFPMVMEIYKHSNHLLELGHIPNEDNNPVFLKFIEEYNTMYDEYKELIGDANIDEYSICCELFFDPDVMLSFLQKSYELNQKLNNFYTIRDLYYAKEDIKRNLKYFMTEEEISSYEEMYTEALKKQDIPAMKQILNTIQQLILKHWKDTVVFPEDFRQGDKFKMICHSTTASEYKGKFHTRYVSTSLLTESVNSTFGNNYGFVFAPENIVGAKSSDMGVYNSAKEEELLFTTSTSLNKIDSPERLVEECLELIKLNAQNNDPRNVYNEVVLDGFNPIAIFCLTDGSKELNPDYMSALKVQKQFPGLKIIDIDMTYYKKGQELLELKRQLIVNILKKISKSNPLFQKLPPKEQKKRLVVSDYLVERYSDFFKEFMTMKENGTYSVEKLLEVYNYYDQMVLEYLGSNEAFDKYTIKELRYILNHSIFFDLKEISKGRIDGLKLSSIASRLTPFVDNAKLQRVMPELVTFIRLYKRANLSKDEWSLITGTSLKEINQKLILVLSTSDYESKNLLDELLRKEEDYVFRIDSYQNSVLRNREILDEYEENDRITDYEPTYVIASHNITDREIEIDVDSVIEADYLDRENDYKDAQERYNLLIARLKRHKILNYFRLKRVEKELAELTEELNAIIKEREFYTHRLRFLGTRIEEIRSEFFERTGIEHSNYSEILNNAKIRNGQIDRTKLEAENYSSMHTIGILQAELDQLRIQINEIQAKEPLLSDSDKEVLTSKGYVLTKSEIKGE